MDEYNEDHREPLPELDDRRVKALESIARNLMLLLMPMWVIAFTLILK